MSSKKIYLERGSSSSSEDEVTSKDIEKIQTLWKDVKENKKSLENVKTIGKNEQLPSGVVQKENRELKEKLKLAELQLNEAKDSVTILKKKLKDAEDEIERCHSKIAKQINLNSIQTNQIHEMSTKVDNMSYSQKEIIEKSRESNQCLLAELEDKTKEIANLKAILKDKADKLSVVSVSYDQNNAKLTQSEQTLQEKDDLILSLKSRLEDAQNEVIELKHTRKTEGTALLEIEHLRGDVQRLVKMLRTTKEYQDFSNFADDTSGSIRFLKESKRTSKLDLEYGSNGGRGGSASPRARRICTINEDPLVDEKMLWIPQEAYKFVQEFRRKYKGELTDSLIEKLLFELNRIWSKREQQQLNRLKNQYSAEVAKLTRKIKHHPSYDEVQSKETINRLKQQVKNSYKDQRELFADRPSKNPPGTKYVNETVKMANDFDRQKKTLEKENQYLREQIKGSVAFGKQDGEAQKNSSKEIEKFKRRVEDLINEFTQKRKELMDTFDGKPELSLLLRKQDWFLESLESVLGAFNSNFLKGRTGIYTRSLSRKELSTH